MHETISNIDSLIREEKRLTSAEAHSEAWADGLSAGIEPEIIAEAAFATACAELVRTGGERAALALIEQMHEKIASGDFEAGRTRH